MSLYRKQRRSIEKHRVDYWIELKDGCDEQYIVTADVRKRDEKYWSSKTVYCFGRNRYDHDFVRSEVEKFLRFRPEIAEFDVKSVTYA